MTLFLQPDKDPDTEQMAALWCCRLLPFAEPLAGGTKNPVDVQLTALSALSEVPSGAFLAGLLALYFPDSSSNDRCLDSKFQRLMTRLRSTHDPTSQQPLSVIYQTKSQQVLTQCSGVFGDRSTGQFGLLLSLEDQKLFEHDFKNVELCTQALNVGCFMFEYDVDYLNFLDTLFAVTVHSESYKPTTSKLMSSFTTSVPQSTDKLNLATSPFISERIQLVKTLDSDTQPCYHSLLPLLHMLKEWSEIPQLQSQSQRRSGQSDGKVKSKKGDGVLAMRVNVPLELVVSCLKQQEDEVHLSMRNEINSRLESRDLSDHTPLPQASSGCAVHSPANGDKSMHIDELDGESTTDKSELRDTRTTQAQVASLRGKDSRSRQSSHSTKDSADIKSGDLPLLQVPKGVLQVSHNFYTFTIDY